EIARALGVRMHEDDEAGAVTGDSVRSGGTGKDQSERPSDEPDRGASPASSVVAIPEGMAPDLALVLARNSPEILERLPIGVMVSRGGDALYLNRTLLDLLGYEDVEDFRNRGGLDRMFRGRDPDALVGGRETGAIPIITSDGDAVTVDGRLHAIEWDGAPATLRSFRRSFDDEVGPRLRALELELRLRETEARELRAILDTATDGIAVIDREGRILALNRSAEALFCYDQNEVAGEEFSVLLAPESHARAAEYLGGLKADAVASVLNDGREVLGRERQGGLIPLFMTLGHLANGTEQKFCAVLRDLTQWKKVEKELEEARRQAERASQLKSDFLARVSHEVRTPLNAILGFAEVIIDERFGAIGNERYKDYLRDIHASGSHVMSLVNDLLDLSKIEAGKMELSFGSVDANRIVADCVALMQPEANRERVIIRMALAARLPKIVADERSLRQIVLNLLSNAVKFNEPGGQVIVSSALTDAGHAVVRIRDTGIGMTETDVLTALEPFRQLATSRTRPGTGLGLPLTKALVEANRASFSIKSKKNEGTLIEIAFPPTRVLAR
ncbi:MAG: PAS domain S-box protein, partial [Methylobacteriaceae bacterium]|nr:PAS domain S-box protein [Methylobacteriaceae bacterium]